MKNKFDHGSISSTFYEQFFCTKVIHTGLFNTFGLVFVFFGKGKWAKKVVTNVGEIVY